MNPSATTGIPGAVNTPTDELPPPPVETSGSLARALSAPMALVAAGVAATTYVYLNDPNVGGSIFPKCPLKFLTGLDCPGCGLTRAVYSLLHGDIVSAISHNLLILFVVPWLIMAVARWTGQRLGYEVPRLFTVKPWMFPTTIVLLTIFTVGRNLPFGPLEWINSGYAGA